MRRRIGLLVLLAELLLATVVFLTGINWGLPSRHADRYLFGHDRQPWSGQQILALAGPTDDDPNRGADVARDPLHERDKVQIVNATEVQRAKIIRRYRLMSHQPDEWNTFSALSKMHPGRLDLDPRM